MGGRRARRRVIMRWRGEAMSRGGTRETARRRDAMI